MQHLFDSSVAHHLIQRLLTEHELVPAQEVFLPIECVYELDEFALLQKFDGVVQTFLAFLTLRYWVDVLECVCRELTTKS